MGSNLSEPSARRVQDLIDNKGEEGISRTIKKAKEPRMNLKLSCRPSRVSFSRCLRAFSEKKNQKGKHIVRHFSLNKGELLSSASCKIPRSTSFSRKLVSGRVLRWEIKEYVFMFKKLQKINKPTLGFHKEYNITRILFSQKNRDSSLLGKEELWEEVLRARPTLQTGKSWIDLKIKI
jgi:hypothetical protein